MPPVIFPSIGADLGIAFLAAGIVLAVVFWLIPLGKESKRE